VVLCKWAEFSRPASAGLATMGWWPIMAEQGSALGQRWPCRLRLAGSGGGKGGALGRHADVVNSIRGQQGGVAHRGCCSTVVGSRPEGIGVEVVAGGHWRPGVGAGRRPAPRRCSGWRRRGRKRTGVGWHCGGPWWQRRSSGSTLQCLCFDDNGAGLGLEGGGGARGVVARALKAQRHGQVDGG
jgi:hypothetical protein